MKCPICGKPVEDEGPCIPCWDRTIERGANTSAVTRTNYNTVLKRRDSRIKKMRDAGMMPAEIAKTLCVSRRTVYRVLR